MIRSGYSFKHACGHLKDVVERVSEIGWNIIPISDRLSTFSFVKLDKMAKEVGLRPIFGVELPVTASLCDKQPIYDHWRFLAIDSLRPLHDLVYLATSNPGREPVLTYHQAMEAVGVMKIAGPRLLLDHVAPSHNLYVAIGPSTPKGLYAEAKRQGFAFCATSDNVYPRASDLDVYRVIMGRRADMATYPRHILSDDELRVACWYASDEDFGDAVENRHAILDACRAELVKAKMLIPPKEKTLREMCIDGAIKKGVDLNDVIYAQRLERELEMIEEKDFSDYFYIVADILQWAKERMVCGPGRGSSSGSLVCYLLDITAVDPIKHDLVFERFIDITRNDYPDIDIDVSDARRDFIFNHLEKKYGKDRVARLATVMMFASKSCLNAAGTALGVPKWVIEETSNSIITRSDGDARANFCIADSFHLTQAGRKLIADYPEMAIASHIEAHPFTRGQHAAGMVITHEPVREYVAVDARNQTAMCDLADAQNLDLLKIDLLGLTQLSIFERALKLIGKSDVSGFLETIPLDDPAAFNVLNRGTSAGVFQFVGASLKGVTRELKQGVNCFEDLVALTALTRPGPMGSGAQMSWVRRKNGDEEIKVDHHLLEPYVLPTRGLIIFQEQVMKLGREIGGLSWEDVTILRKSMGKSLGKEHFDQLRDKFVPHAMIRMIPRVIAIKLWNDMCNFGAYAFNRSHSVAYSMVSYWCLWFKAHHPVEFAAATLDAEGDPAKQIAILRELREEGIDYIPVDPDHSTERWNVVEKEGKKILVGPLTTIKGIGPASIREIMECRGSSKPLREALRQKLAPPQTEIGSLYPIRDAISRLWPDLTLANIRSKPKLIKDAKGTDVVVIGLMIKNKLINENEPARVAKRGFVIPLGQPVEAFSFHLRDDTDDIFCKVDRRKFKFPYINQALVAGNTGKSLFAIKGNVPLNFRMIWVEQVKYLGEIDNEMDTVASPSSLGDGRDLPTATRV